MKNKFRKGLVVGIIFLLMLVAIPMVSGDIIEYPKEEGPYFVYMSGNCHGGSIPDTVDFDYRGLFRDGKPMWFQLGPLSLNRWPRGPGYELNKGSIFIVNGKIQDVEYPINNLILKGFKGYAPAIWQCFIKAPIGRIRVFGVCEEISLMYV